MSHQPDRAYASSSMATPKTDTYHHGNLREALLDAVGDIIKEKGVSSVSLREAARRAGVSHGAPAHHFGDKMGMLTAYTTRGFELFGRGMRGAAATGGTAEEKIRAVGIEYLRFAVEQRAYFELMFRADMNDSEDQDLHLASTGAFSVLTGIAQELITTNTDNTDSNSTDSTDNNSTDRPADGEVTPDAALTLALGAWAQVHGLATLWLDGAMSHFWDGDDILELALAIFQADDFGPDPGGSSHT